MAYGFNEDILSSARNPLHRFLSFGPWTPQGRARSWVDLWLPLPFWKV